MFQIRDIVRQNARGVPDGSGTVLEDRYPDPPEGTNSVLPAPGDSASMGVLDAAAAGGEIPFNTDAPLVPIPGSPAPPPAAPAGQTVMTPDGKMTQGPAEDAPPAPTTAEMLAQGPATDFGYGTELNEDGQRVAVTPQRHQAMTDAGHCLGPTAGQWVNGTPTAAPGQRRGRGAPAARLTQTTTASPHMTSLMYATKERGDSLAALADAQADQDEATAVIYGEMADQLDSEAERLGQMRQQAIQQAQESSARLQAQADELGATEPQVGRLFGTGAQAAAMGAALSIAAGAMLSVRRGGNNVALSIVQKAIDRDMAAQKLAIQNKQYALRAGLDIAQQMQAAYRDDLTASKAMQATLEKYAVNRLEAITRASNRPLLEAKAQAGIADLNLKFMATLEEVTREKYQLNIAGPTARLQNIVASAMGQTLPPMLNPKQADPALTEDAAVNAAGAKRGQSDAARKRGQDARNQGRKIRKDATPQTWDQNPLFTVQVVQGQPLFSAANVPPEYALNPSMGSDAGFTLPLKPGQAPPPAPPGWMRFDMPGGRGARYLPQRGVTQADPKVSEAAREFQAFALPIPPGVNVKGGVVSGGKLQVNPGAFGGRTAFNKELTAFRNFSRTYQEFMNLKAEADRLSRDKSVFGANRRRGNTIAEQAAGLVNRMREGGVMGEAEHKRAKTTASNPQERRGVWEFLTTGADFGAEATPEQRGMAGWVELEKIFNDTRQSWYDHFATGGTQAGTASKRDGSEDVTKSRVGS